MERVQKRDSNRYPNQNCLVFRTLIIGHKLVHKTFRRYFLPENDPFKKRGEETSETKSTHVTNNILFYLIIKSKAQNDRV